MLRNCARRPRRRHHMDGHGGSRLYALRRARAAMLPCWRTAAWRRAPKRRATLRLMRCCVLRHQPAPQLAASPHFPARTQPRGTAPHPPPASRGSHRQRYRRQQLHGRLTRRDAPVLIAGGTLGGLARVAGGVGAALRNLGPGARLARGDPRDGVDTFAFEALGAGACTRAAGRQGPCL